MEERLQKILSKCGIASRRKAEEMILEGRVTVNGKVATLGMKADLEKDHIKVDGKLIRVFEPKIYLMFNKPKGCITSMHDPLGRPTIKDFLKGVKPKVFPVGRLDYDSEGLLIITNDGELANALLHPRNKVPKTYHVKVDGFLEDKDVLKLERGIKLEGRIVTPTKVKILKETRANTWIEITIHEGRKRLIRRLFEKLRHPVLKLKRIRINGLELGSLSQGAFRYLTPEEVKKLKKEANIGK
jgi:23S rRNA pseudouridine2605 synthase